MLNPLIRLHIGVALLAATPLFARGLHLSPELMTLVRCAIACAVLVAISSVQKSSLRIGQHRWEVMLIGILMTGHWITYFMAIQKAGVALGVLAFFTYPIWTVLVEPLCHRSRPRPVDLALGVLSLIGLAIALPWHKGHDQMWWGALSGLVSGLFFMSRNLIIRYRLRDYPAIPLMAWQTGTVALVLLPFLAPELAHLSAQNWLWLALLGIVFTAGAHTLFAQSLRYIPVRSASQIAALQPIYAPIYAGLILSEWPDVQTWIGGAIVLAVVLWESQRVAVADQRK